MKTLTGVVLVVAALALPEASRAQRLDERVATGGARGSVAFEFATRANVCGDGQSIEVSDDSSLGWNLRSGRSGMHMGRRGTGRRVCEIGPARVVMTRGTSLRLTVGGPPESASTDLGEVPANEAARYLLAIAPRLDGSSADHAIMGASIAAVPKVWPRLLEIARDNRATEAARKAALFWVSREASEAAVAGMSDVADDDSATMAVRSDALFFLAQREDGSGIEALIRVVRQSHSLKLRKDAIWFLAQSGDPRAVELFSQLLAGR